MSKAKILIIDCETAPIQGYLWATRDQTISLDMIVHDSYMLCWSAKWYGKRQVLFDAIWKHPLYKKDNKNDREIAKSMHKLFNEADIIMGHNGDSFDIKWFNTLFQKHGLRPPSPYKTIDTLKVCRKAFRLTSYKLEFLLKKFGVGEKMKHYGFKLWPDTMAGKPGAIKIMTKYNKKDVTELEKLYDEVRPWAGSHPNVNLYGGHLEACPNCASNYVQRRGRAVTVSLSYPRYQCQDCGRWWRGRKAIT